MKADAVLHGIEGFSDWVVGLVNRMKAGAGRFCGWCATRNPFGREGWPWAVMRLVALAVMAVLCVPCLAVCLVGLALGVALLVMIVVGLAGYALLMGLVVVLTGLWDWGVLPLQCFSMGLELPAPFEGRVESGVAGSGDGSESEGGAGGR